MAGGPARSQRELRQLRSGVRLSYISRGNTADIVRV